MLSPQSPQRAPTGHIAIDDDLSRATWVRSECSAEERLGCSDPSVAAQEEVDCLALLVDGAVQVVPAVSKRDAGLIHTPRSADGSSETVPALFELGHVSDHLSHDCCVRHGDAAIGHQLDEIAI